MDSYFCIFCKIKSSDQNDIYEHIKNDHFKDSAFCRVCDCIPGATCGKEHPFVGSDPAEEDILVDIWLDRLLSFQEELIKTNAHLLWKSNQKMHRLFLGCPVCDMIIGTYKINVNDNREVRKTPIHVHTVRHVNGILVCSYSNRDNNFNSRSSSSPLLSVSLYPLQG